METRHYLTLAIIALVIILVPTTMCRCTRVDSSEVGIKFNKLSLTDQGNHSIRLCILQPDHNRRVHL